MKKYILTIFQILFFSYALFSQKITGKVMNTNGEPLPFASIWSETFNKGTTANENGEFGFQLSSGEHKVTFRFVGHTPKDVFVVLENNSEKKLQIVLEEQAVTLSEVKIAGLKEDPAIGMIRRMISMAPFHLNEITSYQSKAYIKGNGIITSMSKVVKWAVGKQMEKDAGIKVGSLYMLEGVNTINYQKPNKIREKVISKRTNLPAQFQKDDGVNLRVAQTNFYRPRVWGNLISPIAPNAFQFYQYNYLGSFKINDLTISKIQVKPKVISNELFEGILNVVEDTWSIYSFQLRYKDSNSQSKFEQQNAMFNGVWMPIQYSVRSNIDVVGIGARFEYVTQIKEYDIKLDPIFVVKPQIIEERLNKNLAKDIDKVKIKTIQDAKKSLEGEITRKKLKKALKKIEKQKIFSKDSVAKIEFSSEFDFEVDSLANKKSDVYWQKEREIPLSELELKAFKEADSLYLAGAEKRRKDSINNLPKFKWSQIYTGKLFDYSKKGIGNSFRISGFSYDFNAVNGNTLTYKLEFLKQFEKQNSIKIYSDIHWALNREAINGSLGLYRQFQNGRQAFGLKIGNELFQNNNTSPISDRLNSFYALLLNKNYAKFYNKEYINLFYSNRIAASVLFSVESEFRNRSSLLNSVEYGIFRNSTKFLPNYSENDEIGNTVFSNDQQFVFKGTVQWQPNAVFRRFNQSVYVSNARGVVYKLSFSKAILENSFSSMEISAKQKLILNRLGEFTYQLAYHAFLQKPSNFLDFTHFKGNEILFTTNTNEGFKALPYYQFSTSGSSLQGHFIWEPKKFLLNQFNLLYGYGLKESIQYSALYFPNSNQQKYYQEINYRVDGIFKAFGVDLVYPIGTWVPEKMKVLIRVPF